MLLLQKGRLNLMKPPASVLRLLNFEYQPLPVKRVLQFEGAIDSCGDYVATGVDGDYSSSPLVPRGYLAVYVGQEAKRFVIPLSYLSHAIFKALLRKAEEEFGFASSGGIKIPCESLLFEHILWLLKKKDPIVHDLEMVEELLGFYAQV